MSTSNLFEQLTRPVEVAESCAVRRHVLNDNPANQGVIRDALEDLKLLGITELVGLKNPRHPQDPRRPGKGIEALVYEIPGMNAVVRFSTRPTRYHYDHRNMLLGSTKPEDKAVMQPFMEFSVPNRTVRGHDLYVEIAALGRPVGRERAELVDWMRRRRGITGHNRTPAYRQMSDMGAGDNNLAFGKAWFGMGQTMLIDVGEVDYHLFTFPSQRTDWRKRPEFQSLTEAGKQGKWFDPQVHKQIYMRQLKRSFERDHAEWVESAGSEPTDWAQDVAKVAPAELKNRHEQTLVMSGLSLLTRRFGASDGHMPRLMRELRELTGQAPDAQNMKAILIRTAEAKEPQEFKMALNYALKEQHIPVSDLLAATSRDRSLAYIASRNKDTLNVLVEAVGREQVREMETSLPQTMLAQAISSGEHDRQSLRLLASLPGADITLRDSHQNSYLDYAAERYFRTLQNGVPDFVERAKMLVSETEALIREKGEKPEMIGKKDGAYQRYAQQRDYHADIERMRRKAWEAKAHIPLP